MGSQSLLIHPEGRYEPIWRRPGKYSVCTRRLVLPLEKVRLPLPLNRPLLAHQQDAAIRSSMCVFILVHTHPPLGTNVRGAAVVCAQRRRRRVGARGRLWRVTQFLGSPGWPHGAPAHSRGLGPHAARGWRFSANYKLNSSDHSMEFAAYGTHTLVEGLGRGKHKGYR